MKRSFSSEIHSVFHISALEYRRHAEVREKPRVERRDLRGEAVVDPERPILKARNSVSPGARRQLAAALIGS
jgi:hypothetical protein